MRPPMAHGHAHSPRPRSQAKWAIKFIHQGITTSRHTGNSHAALAYCMGSWHERTFLLTRKSQLLEGMYSEACSNTEMRLGCKQPSKHSHARQHTDSPLRISRSLACQIIMQVIDLVNYATY